MVSRLWVRPDQRDTEVFGDEPFKVTAGEAIVAEDDLPGVDVPVLALEQRLGDFAFPEFRVREPPNHGHAFWGANQIEPESPEEAPVRGAGATVCVAGQVGAFDRSPRHAAGQRSGVDKAQDLVPGRGVPG